MKTRPKPPQAAEQGFMLLGLIVAIFLILLVLGVAAPRMAKSLRRDREEEAIHRGKQYVRAIRQYYLKTGHYPGSMEQLEKTNNVRFLRQRYADPLNTNAAKPEWRLIHVGEAKTTVKGFFGKPLSGLPGSTGGLGSAAGLASSGAIGAGAAGTTPTGTAANAGSTFGSSSFGSSGSSGSSFGGSSSSFGSNAGSAAAGSQAGSQTGSQTGSTFGSVVGGTGTTGVGSSTGIGSQSATSFTGTGAPIMGVGSSAPGDSIVVLNEQTTYPTWEFLYDPRIEQLKAKAALLGGPASSGTSGFGGSATSPGLNGTTLPGATPTPAPAPTVGVPVQP